MNPFRILSATALILAAPLCAQEPAKPAPATPPAAPAETPPATTPPATPPADPGKKVKLGPAETKALGQVGEAILFQRSIAELGKTKAKDNAEVGKFAEGAHKELVDLWTPLVSLGQARNVVISNDLSKGSRSDIDKVSKAKPEKFAVEYFELFSKAARRNVRTIETAAKSFTDPEVKTSSGNLLKVLTAQAEQSEKTYKDLKAPKKEPAKK